MHDGDALTRAALAALATYERKFCSQTLTWKKEVRDPSHMDVMPWLLLPEMHKRLDAPFSRHML
jgi:hypothetical protein